MHDRAARATRGWLVGAVSMLIAAISHSMGGGDIPGWLGILVGFVAAGLFGTAMLSRRGSLPRLAIVVAVSQAAFHYVFATLGGPEITASIGMRGMTGSTASVSADPASAAAADTMGAHGVGMHAAGMSLWDPRMTAAHAIAAVITILALRHVEATLWRMIGDGVRRLSRALIPNATVPHISTPPRVSPVERPAVALPLALLRSPLARRGPPNLVAA